MPGNKEEEKVELAEVAIQTGKAYKLPDGKIVALEDYLIWMGNLLNRIAKSIG